MNDICVDNKEKSASHRVGEGGFLDSAGFAYWKKSSVQLSIHSM